MNATTPKSPLNALISFHKSAKPTKNERSANVSECFGSCCFSIKNFANQVSYFLRNVDEADKNSSEYQQSRNSNQWKPTDACKDHIAKSINKDKNDFFYSVIRVMSEITDDNLSQQTLANQNQMLLYSDKYSLLYYPKSKLFIIRNNLANKCYTVADIKLIDINTINNFFQSVLIEINKLNTPKVYGTNEELYKPNTRQPEYSELEELYLIEL